MDVKGGGVKNTSTEGSWPGWPVVLLWVCATILICRGHPGWVVVILIVKVAYFVLSVACPLCSELSAGSAKLMDVKGAGDRAGAGGRPRAELHAVCKKRF